MASSRSRRNSRYDDTPSKKNGRYGEASSARVSHGETCKDIENKYGAFGWTETVSLAVVTAVTMFNFEKAFEKHKKKSDEKEKRERERKRAKGGRKYHHNSAK